MSGAKMNANVCSYSFWFARFWQGFFLIPCKNHHSDLKPPSPEEGAVLPPPQQNPALLLAPARDGSCARWRGRQLPHWHAVTRAAETFQTEGHGCLLPINADPTCSVSVYPTVCPPSSHTDGPARAARVTRTSATLLALLRWCGRQPGPERSSTLRCLRSPAGCKLLALHGARQRGSRTLQPNGDSRRQKPEAAHEEKVCSLGASASSGPALSQTAWKQPTATSLCHLSLSFPWRAWERPGQKMAHQRGKNGSNKPNHVTLSPAITHWHFSPRAGFPTSSAIPNKLVSGSLSYAVWSLAAASGSSTSLP